MAGLAWLSPCPWSDRPHGRRRAAIDDFPEQIDELLGFLGNDFPEDHPYRGVPAVPGPWQQERNRVPQANSRADIWIPGSSIYSAHLAARLGRPYAFALQFGSADILNAMRIYRENFRSSPFLDKPYSLVSVGVVQATFRERQIIEEYTDRVNHGTTAGVAQGLEELAGQTRVDEVLLVVQGTRGVCNHAQWNCWQTSTT
ncbi:hypothetical protein [Arthrobacter sp. HS15c]|uniref:hypothetical protein n=1 Tax=Arthrobacter sp. HS15c TaxID=3230279 RepID=UPI003465486D